MNGKEMNFHGPFCEFCHYQIEKQLQKEEERDTVNIAYHLCTC